MDAEGWLIRNQYQTMALVAMESAWCLPNQCAFNRAEVMPKINDHLGQNGCQSDEIVVPEPGGPFIEYEDEW